MKFTGYDPQTPAWPRGPDAQGGCQLDGRADTLQNQALGAFQNHAKVTRDPEQTTLDDVATYLDELGIEVYSAAEAAAGTVDGGTFASTGDLVSEIDTVTE